jgi:hypothetical protein
VPTLPLFVAVPADSIENPRGTSVGAAQVAEVELDGGGWILIEVGVPDPGWLGADVGDARPALSLAAVGERLEVELLQPFKLSASGLVRDAFVLHGALVADRGATDDESDLWIPPQVVDLAARGGGVEEDLEVVCDDDADDCRLGALGRDTDACTASGCSRMKMRSSAVVT